MASLEILSKHDAIVEPGFQHFKGTAFVENATNRKPNCRLVAAVAAATVQHVRMLIVALKQIGLLRRPVAGQAAR